MERTLSRYGMVGAALSGTLAGFELARVIATRGRIDGLAVGLSLVMSVVVVLSAGSAAIGLATRRAWGWLIGVYAFIAGLSFATIALASGAKIGIVHLLLAVAIFVCLSKSLHAYRTVAAG